MGLAASQARFLGLTARKSNVEYQAQQINQARTALSNEVMGLYNEYNNLEVPTPPSVANYQKTTYTLDDTYEDYQITNFSKILDGENKGYYNVTLTYEKELAKAYTYTAQNAVVTAQKGDDGYSYINLQFGTKSYTYNENDTDNSTIVKITGDYEKYQGLSTIMKDKGITDGIFYMYMENGVAYYTSESDLNSTAFEEQNGKEVYYGNYTFDYQGSQTREESVNAIAALTQESTGRLSTIQVMQCDDATDLVGHTYSISTGTVDDEMGYADAMNDYNYKKQLYENEVERINQKTEKIQTEDKSLELELNQLDTEQRAISTEMDSVKEVIQSTLESVFKTFDS